MSAWTIVKLTIVVLASAMAGNLQAGPVWKSDLRINALQLTLVGKGTVQARVLVSTGDATVARGARLELLLPVGVGVIRTPSGCRASPAPVANLSGRVTCDLGDVAANALREIVVLTSAPPATRARYAVMVLSDTPDPSPSNNFTERVLR